MKKLIILCVLVAMSIGAYSQSVRITKAISVDSLKIILDGNTEHTFTIGKHATDTSEVDVILYGGSDIESAFYTQTAADAAFYPRATADATFAPIANGVSNGNTHNHVGGDGATIDHLSLSNIGTNSHGSIDSHISDASNPHGTTLTQTNVSSSGYIRSTGRFYSTEGNITNTSTTVILDTYEEDNGIWLLTFTGENNDYSATFHGYNAYLVSRVRNTYTSSWEPEVIKLGEESYSSRVVVSVNGDDVRLQSSYADATYPLRWCLVRLK